MKLMDENSKPGDGVFLLVLLFAWIEESWWLVITGLVAGWVVNLFVAYLYSRKQRWVD